MGGNRDFGGWGGTYILYIGRLVTLEMRGGKGKGLRQGGVRLACKAGSQAGRQVRRYRRGPLQVKKLRGKAVVNNSI